MEASDKNNKSDKGRRSFLAAGALAVAGLLFGKMLPKGKQGNKTDNTASGEKIKMLTADGKLVEVDKAFIKKSRKASTDDVMHWIHKN